MKLLTILRRLFAVDTNDVPPFAPGRIHDMLAELQKDAEPAIRPGQA